VRVCYTRPVNSTPALPKDLLADPRHDAVLSLLAAEKSALWEGGQLQISTLAPTPALFAVLRAALTSGHATQGLERAADTLAGEQKGLDAVKLRTPQAPNPRISRVLFVTQDGSTRFYRDCEGLARRYAERLLVCRLALTGEALGEALLGTAKLARTLLVTDKRACAQALLACLPATSAAPEPD
jgi:hypothetical protein